MLRVWPISAFLAAALAATSAHAGVQGCLSEAAFRSLAAETAPKVNLFAEAWRQDPKAEFYGGTTRDYLYWLKGKFRECKSPEQAEKILGELRAQSVIDVREFIIGDSDVDVVSEGRVVLAPERFGVKKFDTIKPDIFDPTSDRGRNEVLQGHIPAEKIRLQKGGVVAPGEFGDGLGEIYSGRLTVHFTDPKIFAEGHYAKQGINHPVLMALRYLRLLGINYYRGEGQGYPDLKKLMDIDPASKAAVKKVIEKASGSLELAPFLEKEKFRGWLNGTIQKSFRSYTNPTAALELMKAFGVDKFPKLYPEVEPLNQYLFAKHRDEAVVSKNLSRQKTSPEKLYLPPEKFFPDGYLYHGTQTEEAFRGILLQGILPSTYGSASAGLYGVAGENRQYAEDWGKKENLLRLPVKPDAKVVDVTQGEGKRVWEAMGEPNLNEFAEELGVDIIRYPYDTEAFVVKNSGALGKPEGVYRRIMVISEAWKLAAKADTAESLKIFLQSLELNGFSLEENRIILRELPEGWRKKIFTGKIAGEADLLGRIEALLALERIDPAILQEILPGIRRAVEDFRPASGSLLHFVEINGLASASMKARVAAEALFSSASPKEIAGYLRLMNAQPSASYMWYDHFVQPWAKDSVPVLAKVLKETPDARSVIRALITNKKFVPLLEDPKLNEAYWRAWRDDPGFVAHVYLQEGEMMRDLAKVNPSALDRGLDILLSADPKTWIERAPLGPRGNADSRYSIRALYYAIIPAESFSRHPRAGAWLKEFMNATLEGMESDTMAFAARLLREPAVARHPEATRWMNALVAGGTHEAIAEEILVPGRLGRSISGLLDQEPWKNHPLRDIWLESMKLPRSQNRSLKGMLIKRPRAVYLSAKTKLKLGLNKKIEAWRQSMPDQAALASGDLANGNLARKSDGSCRIWFQKILGGGR